MYKFFAAWEADGITQLLLDMLRERVRLVEGRSATPTAAIIISQTVKAGENVWRSSRGYDAGNYPGSWVMPGRGAPALAGALAWPV